MSSSRGPRFVTSREIEGKRITRLTCDRVPGGQSGGGVLHTDVALHLDDGTILYFITEESEDGGSYGTYVGRTRKQGKP